MQIGAQAQYRVFSRRCTNGPDNVIRRSVRVIGRVQGVGFRYFTVRAAQRTGVAGWVRNEPDGSVVCDAQGKSEAVEEFLRELRLGPRFSRVEDVQVEPLAPAALRRRALPGRGNSMGETTCAAARPSSSA